MADGCTLTEVVLAGASSFCAGLSHRCVLPAGKEMTTEVERPAGGTADQEMKCNEEEEEVLQEMEDEG